jgi:hypothetical protein
MTIAKLLRLADRLAHSDGMTEDEALAEIPRSAAFALGELFDRPRVTRDKLEAFGRKVG